MAGAGGAAVDVVSPSSSIPLHHDRVLGSGDGGGRCLRRIAWAAVGAVSVGAFGPSCRLGKRMSRILVGERRQAREVG